MDGFLTARSVAQRPSGLDRTPSGASFGEAPVAPRPLDPGMGLAVARRTVFRPEDADDFGRVADRVAEGNMALLGRRAPTEADRVERARLRNAIATGALLTSGRHLQHGDAAQPGRNMEVFTNCLGRATKIVTLEYGAVEIEAVLGKDVTVRAADGAWRTARVNHHGRQQLYLLSFGPRNHNGRAFTQSVVATRNHRWFLADGTVTDDIQVGDLLAPLPSDCPLDPRGVTHGLLFGDGSAHKRRLDFEHPALSQGREYTSIRVCKTDTVREQIQLHLEAAGYPAQYPASGGGDPVFYLGKFPGAKDVPFTTDPAYIAGFIHGWWLADGSKTCGNRDRIEISTCDPTAAAWLMEHAAFAGWTPVGMGRKSSAEAAGRFPNAKDLYCVRLARNVRRKLISIEPLGEDEVYCVEEPVTTGFTLANGLLTGNCASAIASFAKFYLLLNGSGVGRAYDDELMAVDWGQAPALLLHLDPAHPDFPRTRADLHRFGAEFGLLPWGTAPDAMTEAQEEEIRAWIAREFLADPAAAPSGAIRHRVEDSREGWAEAMELLESLAFEGSHPTFASEGRMGTRQGAGRDRVLLLDFSAIRRRGAPIAGMQGRPASGPLSLMRAFVNIRQHVIEPARHRDPADEALQPWEQALLVDHHLSVEVQVGGARRAARMATKSWRDPGIFRFIRAKSEGGLWTANNSVMVDREFWDRVRRGRAEGDAAEPLTRHALAVFEEASRCAYINGEPGLINGDLLNDHRTGQAWEKPAHEDGRDFRSGRYRADHAVGLLAELSRRAGRARFPVTTNPCGEITLHVTGGYCVIADFAPLLACPVDLAALEPGRVPEEVAAEWDARVEDSVRLGVRFLMRANLMDALYGEEVRRTNRMGIGPTGLHEWAWMRFGLGFDELLDEERSAGFWAMLDRFSAATKEEGDAYAAELGLVAPFTVTTVKPAGTTSKLFGLTEGAHLPARRQYLRWVQFKGTRDGEGRWATDSDPLLAEYEARGYPVRMLRSFPGMSVVGFPTLPLIQRLGIGERLVTAPDATPEQQYRWLRLLERHWIGAERGNQVSYTLKLYTDRHDVEAFRGILLRHQPEVRCCSILPSRPDRELGYEYLPEEEVPLGRFAAIVAGIRDAALHEAVDMAHLECASGVCPI